MKILYVVSDQDLATYHGGTVHVLAVTGEMLRHGHEVHVVLQETAGPAIELPEGAITHRLPRRNKFLLWKAGPQIDQIMDRVRPEIVIERYYNFAGEGILRAAARGIPSILEVNSPMVEFRGSTKSKVDTALLGKLRRRRERMAESAKIIVAPLKEIVPERFKDKVRLTEWGVDPDLFDPARLPEQSGIRSSHGFAAGEFLFIHFGSLRKWHGVDVLLQAFAKARSASPSCQLIIVGPGDHTPREGVTFAGPALHAEVPLWLKMCDAAVLPFSLEKHRYLELGFYWSPLKVFEAMAMELPVITRDHPRLRDILGTAEPSFYYDGTPEHLARQMLHLAADVERLRPEAQKFRERVLRHYSWRTHGDQLENWIRETTS